MTPTDTLRAALRAYDIAGPETPERAAALAAVLSAAHRLCDTTPATPSEAEQAFFAVTANGLSYQYEGWGGRMKSKHIGADEYRANVLNRLRGTDQ